MPVRNIRSVRPRIFIPTTSDGYAKITITADDDTVYTILDSYDGTSTNNHLISGSFTMTATDKLGNFRFKVANDGGRFLNKFNGGELVKIYGDTSDATTLIFAGKIDDIKYGLNEKDGFFINIDGRDYPELVDMTITGIEASVNPDVAIAGILDEFYSAITLLFWNGSSWSEATYTESTDTVSWSPAVTNFPTNQINMTYQNRKGWVVLKEICKQSGLDAYIEYDEDNSRWTLKLLVQEDIVNSGAGIGYGINLVNLGGYGAANSEIVNRVIVYGKTESDNILLLKTEDDTSSQSNLWVKDRVFNEADLITMEGVQGKADQELSSGTNNTSDGTASVVFLPMLRPGDMINVSIPYTGMYGPYKAQSFTHTFGHPFMTKVEFTRKIKKVGDLFIPKVNPEEFISALSNPNSMRDSYSIYFNEAPSIMTLSNTEETEGRLRLVAGQTTGTAISDTITTDFDVSECEFRKYENFETTLDTYEVSNNGGSTWENYTELEEGETHSFATPGNQLKIRLTLNRTLAADSSPSYESISLLYK